jgi:hypothetical protein
MAELEARYERTFVRLWTHCDDAGRCKDNLRLIKSAIYPLLDRMTIDALDKDLVALEGAGLIVRYEAHGERFIQVVSWDEFQHPQRATKSKLPGLDEASARTPATSNGSSNTSRGDIREPSANTPRALASGGEKEREKEREGILAPLAPEILPPSDPVWEAMLAVCSIREPIPASARGAYNKAAKELRDCGATADEIGIRAGVYRARFQSAPITPSALARHWGECIPTPDHLPRPKVNGNLATLARIAGTDAAH